MAVAKLIIFMVLAAGAKEHAAAPAAEHGAPAATEHGAPAATEHAAASAHSDAPSLPERPAPVSSHDTKVPRKLIEALEAEYARYLTKAAPKAKPDSVKRGLLHVAVELTEAPHAGALDESARFIMAPGGGRFDLSTAVGTHRAGFNLKLVPRDEAGATIVPNRAYFISRAKARTLDGETFGDGCNRFFDITTAFTSRFLTSGFALYTAAQRYVSVVGGTFLLARFEPTSLAVASVTFTDSRYPQLLCE